MSYQHSMSTGAIIVAGVLLAFSDGSRANNGRENPALESTSKPAMKQSTRPDSAKWQATLPSNRN